MYEKIGKILDVAIEKNASDIHLTNDLKPTLRVDGELQVIEEFEVNDREMLREFVKEISNEKQLETYLEDKELDSSISYGDVRFRIHIFRQDNADALALRLIPRHIPTLEEINVPMVLKKFTTMPNGLILVTGVTGSGKSTTLASMIHEINMNYSKHIITIEDPVEYIHSHNKSIINQREVGADVHSFSRAVRAAMREDPDIILVGELRDLDTIHNAITMAETGHLVFGTLHTRSVAETVSRLIDVFPANQQDQIRIQLANSINGIVAQELLPMEGGGRVPSCEVMIANDAIRSLIRENQNPNAIVDQMQMNSKKLGSQTKLQSLANLVVDGKISGRTSMKNLSEGEIDSLKSMVAQIGRGR